MVIMKDPDSGWINYGAYRIQVHDRNVASVMTSKGKHGNLIMRKYHERGEPCPIAVVIGMHPALFMVAGIEIPYGKNEYDAAGGLIGEPVEIITGPRTGLPIPAHAEAAFEGFVHPNDLIDEGPLGEWTGYYAGGLKKEPKIRVESFFHRDQPVLLGAIPAMPPNDDTFYRGTYRCGAVWNQLEAAGVPEVKGVWSHEAGGSRLWLTVAIKQLYGGHSKQAGLIASQCHAGAYANRWVVVVDDDGARPDGLWPRRPAQRPRRDRRLPPVVAARHFSDRGALEQGARRPRAYEIRQRLAEGVLNASPHTLRHAPRKRGIQYSISDVGEYWIARLRGQ